MYSADCENWSAGLEPEPVSVGELCYLLALLVVFLAVVVL